MDFLKKAGNFLGNAAYQAAKFVPGVGNVIRSYEQVSKNTNLARQQAANKLQQQNRPVPQQLRQAPAPRLDYNAAMQALNAIKNSNVAKPVTGMAGQFVQGFTNPIVHTVQDIPKLASASYHTALGLPQFIANPSAKNAQFRQADQAFNQSNTNKNFFAPIKAEQDKTRGQSIANQLVGTGKGLARGAASAYNEVGTYATLPLTIGSLKMTNPSLAAKIIAGAKGGAFYGGLSGVSAPVAEGNFNLKDIATQAATGAGSGAVLGAALPAASAGVQKLFGNLHPNIAQAAEMASAKHNLAGVGALDAQGLVKQEGSKVRIDPKTGKKVFAPQYNAGNTPVNNPGVQANDFQGKIGPVEGNRPRLSTARQNGKFSSDQVTYESAKSLKIGSDALHSSVDDKTVLKYMEKIERGKKVDPVIVSYKDNVPYIVDGKHRFEAYKKLGYKEIPVVEQRPKVAAKATTPSNPTLYHGTAKGNDFSVYDKTKASTGTGDNAFNQGDVLYLTENKDAARFFSRQAQDSALRTQHGVNAGSMPRTEGNVLDFQLKSSAKVKTVGSAPTKSEMTRLAAQGYDAVRFKDTAFDGVEGDSLANAAMKNGTPYTTAVLNDKAVSRAPVDSMYGPGAIGNDVPSSVMSQIDGKKPRGFIKTVQNSPSTTAEVAAGVKGSYVPKTNDKLVTKARGAISSDIMKAEKTAKTQITDEGVATASELIKHYQAIGQYDKAIEVAQVAAKNLTEAGRTVQAASIYSRISPEGILRSTSARIEKAGGNTLAPDVAERLTKMAQAVQKMPDGQEKLYAVAKLQQEVSSLVPSSILEKATTLRKAGLLTGLKTQAGNAVSNLSHIGLNKVSDLPAAGVDALASIFTGKRTKTFTFRGQASGAKEGSQKAVKFLKTGVDELGLGTNKYDITPVNFKNKAVQKYVDTVFNTMGAADKPYRYSVFKNQLNDLALAEAKNKGVRGKEATKFINDFVSDPPPAAAKTAMDYAEKSVFGNDTVLSKVATGIRSSLRDKHPAAAAAVDIVAPFTKVPSAVITRLFEYTPVGAVKEAARQIKSGKFDQRAMAQTLGEVGTGTGVLYLGNALASQGQITGPMPTDQKERDLWQLEGKQPNAIRFGDKWYSFNYTSPVGQLLQMGAQIADGSKQGKNAVDAIASGVAGGAKAVVDQSFLQGIQGALDALTDPTRYADTFLKSTAGSVVPTLAADTAKAIDPLQRQTNSIQEAVAARVPGLRNSLLPKQDAFGNSLKRQQDPLGTMIDPFRTTNATENDPLVGELRRLQNANQGVVPNADGQKSIQVGNTKYPLKPEELNKLNTATGQATQKLWSDTTNNPQYGTLADDSKKKVLSNIYSDVNVVEKYKLLMDGAINDKARGDAAQQMYDKLTKSQMDYLLNGTVDINSYLSKELPKTPKVALSKASKAPKVKATKSKKVGRAKSPRYRQPKFSTAKAPKISAVKAKGAPKIKFAKAPKGGKTARIKV